MRADRRLSMNRQTEGPAELSDLSTRTMDTGNFPSFSAGRIGRDSNPPPQSGQRLAAIEDAVVANDAHDSMAGAGRGGRAESLRRWPVTPRRHQRVLSCVVDAGKDVVPDQVHPKSIDRQPVRQRRGNNSFAVTSDRQSSCRENGRSVSPSEDRVSDTTTRPTILSVDRLIPVVFSRGKDYLSTERHHE